jgi:hypothetical protein
MAIILVLAIFCFSSILFQIVVGYLKRKEEEKRNNSPCRHGVPGALWNGGYGKCVKCEQENKANEQRASEWSKEEEAKRKAEKERSYKEWVAKIRLPEYLINMHPEKFEHLICDLFRKMGYQVEHTQYTGDSGIDGYLKKNGDLSILQCKRVKGSVGELILRDLFGTMHATGARGGFVVTTGKVSQQAKNWATNKPIRIIETDELVNYIRTYYKEDEVVPEHFAPDQDEHSFCPKCGSPLRVVNWKGRQFMGCSAYPSCQYTTAMSKTRYPGG